MKTGDLHVHGSPSVAEHLTPSQAALSHEIALARQERRVISGRRGVLDLEAAYRIQRQRTEDRTVVGAKIEVADSADPARSRWSTPMHAPVLAEMLLEGPVVELSAFVQPRLEPELAVVLAADVPPGSLPGDAARAVTGVFLAVDILDTVWDGYRSEEPEAVADGANGGGILLGEQLLPLELAGELRLHVGGELLAACSVAELGDPVAQIAWLASEVDGLGAGGVVLLGSPAASVPVTSGTLLVEGPLGSSLSADLRGPA